ncbi:DMT family transporter [Tolypothrix bouteillei VB521301]|nr:DMT family transporter [Tolypothrix bouteillei VB521301]
MLLFILSLLWGGSYFFIKIVLVELQPFTVVLGRVSFAAIANLIYFRILAVAGATNASLVTFLIPISALLLGVFVLGERLDWNTFAGMSLIFTGLAAIDGRLLRLP